MKVGFRYSLLLIYSFLSFGFFYFCYFILFQYQWSEILSDWTFYPMIFFFFLSVNEILTYCKIGKRSELSDLVAILYFVFLIFFITKDFLTSLMGAFSIYLWFGIYELREYPVINKILIITLVTYNIIFIAGLISFYLVNPFYINTAFAFSFWIILILGFLLFGRKYIIVWRFMSPAYLLLFLYIIAWLAVIFINQYTQLEFIYTSPLDSEKITISVFIMNIYFVLIVVNWIVYFISGVVLDKLLGIKRIKDDTNFLNLVENVKNDIGIKGKVKVGFGKYPILNAMAYGSFFDKRIAIIAEDIDQIPEDELKGIVAHELAHTKGKHTLILTFITTADLVFRMILGLPATYYDYTFGHPQIPMIAFIFLNLGIYIFLFIFVRMLEGRADLNAKKAGYGKELAKALYNLESFYATGREFGLNTMLLSDEKILKDNQMLDYIKTAEYLYQSMIKPSRLSLIANMMNSHPPSYFRFVALLSDNLKPGKEAILPFICLRRSKQKIYAKKFETARIQFKNIANEKFKEKFAIKDVASLLESLNKKELYNTEINKEYIFKHKITEEILIGKLEDIQFIDDICDSDKYVVSEFKTLKIHYLNQTLYKKIQVNLNSDYFIQKNISLKLRDININKNNLDGDFIFIDKNNNKILKSINKTKLPIPMEEIFNLKDQDVFMRLKDEIKILRCTKINTAEILDLIELEFLNVNNNLSNVNNLRFKLDELIIRPRNITISISRNNKYRKNEKELLKWLLNKKIRSYFFLKKPVNNLEIGTLIELNLNIDKEKEILDKSKIEPNNYILVKNIFGKTVKIPYNKLEMINFDYKTVMIQKRSETSLFTKLGYKILNKISPEKVLYLQ